MIIITSLPPHTEFKLYVTIWLPEPATEGSNVPKTGSVIPAPDQVPPCKLADKLIGAIV